MVFPCWNRLFRRICVMEHSFLSVNDPQKTKIRTQDHALHHQSINVNVFLELVGLVTFTGRVRCWDGNLAVWISYLCVFSPILAERLIVSSCTRIFSHHSDTLVLWVYVCSDLECRWSVSGGCQYSGVVHGCGFGSFTFGGQWWCNAWSWFEWLGQWFESLNFFCQWWCSAWSWVRIFDFVGVNGGVVHVVGLNIWL
jgi:hypothetical protein